MRPLLYKFCTSEVTSTNIKHKPRPPFIVSLNSNMLKYKTNVAQKGQIIPQMSKFLVQIWPNIGQTFHKYVKYKINMAEYQTNIAQI